MPTRNTRTARKAPKPKIAPSKARVAARRDRGGNAAPAVTPAPRGSKQSQLIDLLRSSTGATIKQMTTLTGWQAHTVRGSISGVLRRRLGLNVACASGAGDGPRIYHIVDR